MESVQHILVYITLAVAVGYLIWKFILPKTLIYGKKNGSKSCGEDNCGCN